MNGLKTQKRQNSRQMHRQMRHNNRCMYVRDTVQRKRASLVTALAKKHPEKREQILNAISRNAIRLQKLTADILDVTRIESQTLRLTKEQFDLNDLIDDIVEDYKNQIEKAKKNVDLLYSQSPIYHDDDNDNDNLVPVMMVEADKGRIAQVMYNLLSNAVKFTEKKHSNQEVIINVKDNGEGIHHEIIPRLFRKFATKSFDGTGLGLYISKDIIEAHEQRIWAENNIDLRDNGGKKGDTFYFILQLMTNQIQSNNSNEQGNYLKVE